MPRVIFKIFRPGEWRAFAESGLFQGSPDDARDGFIHLSYGDQIAETLERHYAGEAAIFIAGFDEAALGPHLRAEPSRGGALFPHLYGALTKAGLLQWARLERRASGFALPDWCKAP